MKAYIYFIVNNLTGERYVGQTTNFARRKKEHLSQLRNNSHINSKLQNSWNKYGEENFIIEKIQYDNISKDELNEEEKRYIKKYDSYNNGYNLTLGGDGGDTRSKLTFEQFCFAYFGNRKYDGMTNRTGLYLGVDSSSISSIKNEKSYSEFRSLANKLTKKEQEFWIKEFEEKLDIKSKKPWVKQKTLDDKSAFEILCVASTYGRGIESTIIKHFGLKKGFLFHLMTGKGRTRIKEEYKNTSEEKRKKIGKEKFQEWNLQSYSKNKIKEQYRDLFIHYGIADLK